MQPAWESLHLATSVLVASGSIKARLSEAYLRYLEDLDPSQVPREIRDDYVQLTRTLTHVQPLRGETAVTATVRKMSNEEADRCAAMIVAMLASLYRSQITSSGPAAEVFPLHAADG